MQSMSTLMIQGRLYLYISDAGTGGPGGPERPLPPPPNIWQISYPYSNQGRADYPHCHLLKACFCQKALMILSYKQTDEHFTFMKLNIWILGIFKAAAKCGLLALTSL